MHHLVLFALALALASGLKAQESVNTSGADASGSGGSVAFSVGQVSCTQWSGTGGTSSEGVQQPSEFFIVHVGNVSSEVSIIVYPNPTAETLTIDLASGSAGPLSYRLFDMQGKLVAFQDIISGLTAVDLIYLSPSTYLLEIVDQQGGIIQSFQIIKSR